MDETLLLIFNLIIVFANLCFAYVYFSQLRQSKRGIIFTKFMSYEKEGNKQQSIREDDPFYFYIENKSQNIIQNLKVNIKIILIDKEKKIIGKKRLNSLKIDYINPCERIKTFLFRLGKFEEIFPELFKKIISKNKKQETLTPKGNLKIKLYLEFKWGGLIKYKQKDFYEIEWMDTQRFQSFKHHPPIRSFNVRNDFAVEKIE